ncbi:MAG: 30S ribosomal protein S9 [Opitutales bacterium]|nr:30S ribosomal protein S9 [Opitutales bacterium]
MSQKDVFTSVGRRKTAVARVSLSNGTGNITVNGKALKEYCYTDALLQEATRPLAATGLASSVDATIKVNGGGATGQAGAISHGLARALQKMDENLRAALKKAGLITRDGRAKERKKSGQPGARKRFQFSKR